MTKKGTKRGPYKRRQSTALAIRKPSRKAPAVKASKVRALAIVQPPTQDLNLLGEEAALGALGLAEVKLTEKEEGILSRPVLATDVLVKPTGQPYLSHPSYTKWFNDAFGRLGWSIVPRAKAQVNGKTVVQPFILYIHGTPAAFAYGEQEYHENNKEQTYGDAIEATVASALRRCAKRLGVGLELWDKDWLNRWMREFTVKVWLKDKDKPAFRRKVDPPFWNEVSAERSQERRTSEKREERHVEHSRSDEPITKGYIDAEGKKHFGQLDRLWTIIKASKRSELEVQMWLKARYGFESTKDITRRHYDAICEAIENKGPLPLEEREPGSDDQ